jgi:hypothetical protein
MPRPAPLQRLTIIIADNTAWNHGFGRFSLSSFASVYSIELSQVLAKRTLAVRPLQRAFAPRVLVRCASQIPLDKSVTSNELKDALSNLFKQDQPADGIKRKVPVFSDTVSGGMEELFHSKPPAGVIDQAPPQFTLEEAEIEEYQSLLPDHLTEELYNEFQRTEPHKQIVELMKSRGASDTDVADFEYFILDPEMVCLLSYMIHANATRTVDTETLPESSVRHAIPTATGMTSKRGETMEKLCMRTTIC